MDSLILISVVHCTYHGNGLQKFRGKDFVSPIARTVTARYCTNLIEMSTLQTHASGMNTVKLGTATRDKQFVYMIRTAPLVAVNGNGTVNCENVAMKRSLEGALTHRE